MIQRIQTLFLLEMAFLAVAFLFVPVQFIVSAAGETSVHLMPLQTAPYSSTAGHYAAIAINFLCMVLCFAAIFMYRKRELQVKLCYLLFVLEAVLLAMFLFCPFVAGNEALNGIRKNPLAYAMAVVFMISSLLAARFIKKDIELLKSADRIR